MFGGQGALRQRLDVVEPALPRRAQCGRRWPPRPPPGRRPAATRARRWRPRGVPDVARVHREGRAERVEGGPRAGVGDPIAHGPQERGGPLRFAEHPELVRRPQQRPVHERRFGAARWSRRRPTPVGLAAAALPRQGVGQREPRRQAAGPLQRRSGESFAECEVAQPQRLLARRRRPRRPAGGASLSSASDTSRNRSLRCSDGRCDSSLTRSVRRCRARRSRARQAPLGEQRVGR